MLCEILASSSESEASDEKGQEMIPAMTRRHIGNSKTKGGTSGKIIAKRCVFQFVPKSPDPELLKPCPSKTLTQRTATRGSTKLSAGGV